MDFLRTTDRIDLSGIDANSVGGNPNDTFLTMLSGSGNFTQNSQLRFWNDGTNTYLEGNTDNVNTTAEFSVALVGIYTLATTDIIM